MPQGKAFGAWTAQGILMRGCGVPDAIPTEDAISREAVRHFYGFGGPLTDDEWRRVSDAACQVGFASVCTLGTKSISGQEVGL